MTGETLEPSDFLFAGDAEAGADGAPVLRVRSASGRVVPFDRQRLRDSVERARSAAMARRGGDGAAHERDDLAEEVADIVGFTLESRMGARGADRGRARATVEAGAVADLVERALIEVGAAASARAYIVERDRRERGAGRAGAQGDGGGRLPVVRSAQGSTPFAPHRVVAALVQETGLVPEEAETVAERVGATLLACGLGSVSTALVRELVSHELLAMGRPDALRRHEAIGIPRHDLGRLFQSARPAEAPFGELVSKALIERWATADLLSESVAEAHARADLHVVGLGGVHLPLTRSVPARLLGGAATGEDGARTPGALNRVLDRAAELAAGLAGGLAAGLVIEDAHGMLPDGADGADFAEALVGGLGAVSLAAGAPIDLAITTVGSAWDPAPAEALVRALGRHARRADGAAGIPTGRRGPRLFADFDVISSMLPGTSGGQGLGEVLEGCLVQGTLVPVWSARPAASTATASPAAAARWAAPGLWRGAGDDGALALDAVCCLNLPRLARRAGPWREDAFLESIHGLMRTAVRGLMERAEVPARARRVQGSAIAERGLMAVTPVGLFEALAILGDGLARAEQGARVLGFIAESAARWAAMLMPRGGDIAIALCSDHGQDASRRFAESDARAGGVRQPRLFEDLPRPEEEVLGAYRVGFGDLTDVDTAPRLAHRAAALGALVAGVRTGELLGPGPGVSTTQGASQGDAAAPRAGESDRGPRRRRPGCNPLELPTLGRLGPIQPGPCFRARGAPGGCRDHPLLMGPWICQCGAGRPARPRPLPCPCASSD